MSDETIRQWPSDVLRLESTEAPHGWIQWKGTDVCMDVRCECGELTHLDATFAYVIQCGACGKRWAVASVVRLYPLADGVCDGYPGPKVTSV